MPACAGMTKQFVIPAPYQVRGKLPQALSSQRRLGSMDSCFPARRQARRRNDGTICHPKNRNPEQKHATLFSTSYKHRPNSQPVVF